MARVALRTIFGTAFAEVDEILVWILGSEF